METPITSGLNVGLYGYSDYRRQLPVILDVAITFEAALMRIASFASSHGASDEASIAREALNAAAAQARRGYEY